MNGIVKAALRLSTFRTLAAPLKKTVGRREFTRTIWHMSKSLDISNNSIHKPSINCTCGCGGSAHQIHTKGKNF